MKKLLILGLWVTFGLGWWNIFQWGLEDITPSLLSLLSSLNDEQVTLLEQIREERRAQLPERIMTTDTGKPVYLYPDGRLSFELPDWYQDGQIVFSKDEKLAVANLALITPPPWVFWTDEVTFRAYADSANGLVFGLALGLVAIIVTAFFGLTFGLTFVPVFGLVFGLASGLIKLTKLFWQLPKAIAV